MSLVDKLEIKRSVVSEIGAKVEEFLEGAERDAAHAHGAADALKAHAQNLLSVLAAVDQAVGNGVPDLEAAKMVKQWVGKAIVATENAAQYQKNLELSFLGAVAGHKAMHDTLQKLRTHIVQKQQQLVEQVETGGVVQDGEGNLEAKPGGQRPAGVRPAPPVKQQRQAEAAQEPKKKVGKKKKVAKKAPRKRKIITKKD